MAEETRQNLIQYRGGLSPDEAREYGKKGGVASGKSRRKRQKMREVLKDILSAPVTESDVAQMLEESGLEPTQEAAICLAAVKRARTGDIEACRFIRDTVGEKPVTGVAMTAVEDIDIDSIDKYDLSKVSTADLMALLEREGVELFPSNE